MPLQRTCQLGNRHIGNCRQRRPCQEHKPCTRLELSWARSRRCKYCTMRSPCSSSSRDCTGSTTRGRRRSACPLNTERRFRSRFRCTCPRNRHRMSLLPLLRTDQPCSQYIGCCRRMPTYLEGTARTCLEPSWAQCRRYRWYTASCPRSRSGQGRTGNKRSARCCRARQRHSWCSFRSPLRCTYPHCNLSSLSLLLLRTSRTRIRCTLCRPLKLLVLEGTRRSRYETRLVRFRQHTLKLRKNLPERTRSRCSSCTLSPRCWRTCRQDIECTRLLRRRSTSPLCIARRGCLQRSSACQPYSRSTRARQARHRTRSGRSRYITPAQCHSPCLPRTAHTHSPYQC